MKQPTPQQRLAIYRIALAKIASGRDEFMCNAICKTYELQFLGDLSIGTNDKDILLLFPEFISCMPEKPYCKEVWYNRKELGNLIVLAKRLDVLKKCIRMTERIIEKEKGGKSDSSLHM